MDAAIMIEQPLSSQKLLTATTSASTTTNNGIDNNGGVVNNGIVSGLGGGGGGCIGGVGGSGGGGIGGVGGGGLGTSVNPISAIPSGTGILIHSTSSSVNNSARNSPAIGHRKRYTSTSSCSSQVNNNYSELDMESLEDMLRKVNCNVLLWMWCVEVCSLGENVFVGSFPNGYYVQDDILWHMLFFN